MIAELEPVAVMTGRLDPPLIELGCAQAAVQTRSGLLLGEVAQILAAHPWLAFRHLAGEDREAECWRLAREACVEQGVSA